MIGAHKGGDKVASSETSKKNLTVFHENLVDFWALSSFSSFQMHFAHISVIHILKAMGLRNTLIT